VADMGDQSIYQRTNSDAGKGNERTNYVANSSGQKTNCVARMEAEKTVAIAIGGDQRIRPVCGRGAEKKRKCKLCGEILPDEPDLLRDHQEYYHYQEVIELD